MECNKIKYHSKKQAKKALHNQQDWGARVNRVYFCKECHYYHLTTSRKPFKKSKNKYYEYSLQ